MGFLLFFLILALFFPVLFYPLLIFIALMLIFIPVKFTIDSFFNLFFIPRQIYRIAVNPLLRRNHALEHAAVNILEKEYGYSNLSGYATENGFYIMGVDNISNVLQAAEKGRQLMSRGEDNLAVHKNCGTSQLMINFSSAIIFLFLLFVTGQFSIFYIIIALLLAHLVSSLLGRKVQKRFTTSSDVDQMQIKNAYFEDSSSFIPVRQNRKVFVQTAKINVIE